MARTAEERRRRIGIMLLVGMILLFVVEIVALSLGQLELAAILFVVTLIAWFAIRGWLRRTE